MKNDEIAAIVRGVMPAVRDYIAASTAPLLARIADLEARPVPAAPKSVTGALIARDGSLVLTMSDGEQVPLGAVVGKDGEPADAAAIAAMVRDEVGKAVSPLLERQGEESAEPVTEAFLAPIVDRAVERAFAGMPKPADGKDADMAAVERMVEERIIAAVAAIPPARDGEDGKSVTIDDVRPMIEQGLADAVAALPPAQNGKDADMEALRAEAREIALAAVAEIPVPRDGKDADQAAILEAVMAAACEQVAALPVPQDGKSVTAEDLSPVIKAAVADAVSAAVAEIPAPKDGTPGRDGRDGAQGLPGRDGKDGINGKDGAPGADGADGLGFDDLTLDYDGERTFSFRLQRGETVKDFAIKVPVTLYRGVYRDGGAYERGDAVTWAGSTWIARRDTVAKPDASDDWQLAVKRGREGKAGRDGKDLTAPQPVKI
jgi:hypothetical protein